MRAQSETKTMSMLPEAKLDILRAHHASLEAQLLGQVGSEAYARIMRELAELNPLIDAVKAYRATEKEIADIETLTSAPATEPAGGGTAHAGDEAPYVHGLQVRQKERLA